MEPIDLDTFLSRNNIDASTWECCAFDWPTLQQIAEDHFRQLDSLRDSAELFARVIQRFPKVHSVRWRIKDTNHLLEKIVRKRAEGQEKYKNINAENYFEIVTDLVGLRALHLFKDDCFAIDTHLQSTWTPIESPTAYVREGDPQDLTSRLRDHGFEVKQHPAGYRSVHYVLSTQPLQRRIFAEVQVRTIFEEGWSEIDHRVRYPNYSNDKLVSYFLTIFNRLAGSADEMGTFVQGLTATLQMFDSKLADANKQKEDALSAMDKVLNDFEAMKRQDADANKKITALQQEVSKLRGLPSLNEILGASQRHNIHNQNSAKYLSELSKKDPSISEILNLAATPSMSEIINKVTEELNSKYLTSKYLNKNK